MSKTDNLDLIKEIPNADEYSNNKVTKKSNWFNNNLVLLILILFVLAGIIIAVAISL